MHVIWFCLVGCSFHASSFQLSLSVASMALNSREVVIGRSPATTSNVMFGLFLMPPVIWLPFDSHPDKDAILVQVRSDLTLVICEWKIKKYLGLIVDNKLNFYDHIEYIKRKLSKRIGAMYRSKSLFPINFRNMFAYALMLPQFDYLDIVWSRKFISRLNEY